MSHDAVTTSPGELDLSSPGRMSPRQRANLTRGIQYGILVLVVILVAAKLDWQSFNDNFLSLEAVRKVGGRVPRALGNTLIYTLCAFILSLSLGLVLALMKLSQVTVYRWLATAYIEFFRGLPALMVVFAVGYGVPLALGVKLPNNITLKVALALGMVSAAYLAESLRAGIQAVPKGQVEAARSLGMSHGQTMVSVVIPQAIRIVLPPVTNEIILLTKDTSLCYVLGLTTAEYELAKQAREVLKEPNGGITAFFLIGACYLIITLPLGFLVRRMERSFGKAK
ncbi:MAG: amino acid ABC transporter permease [Bifidobacteriaceae bacterium]|jgi:polar amino acid transport system permease protein|nr:amino acid ABC transporter permease [Bifidobacteriaceae bacterium]